MQTRWGVAKLRIGLALLMLAIFGLPLSLTLATPPLTFNEREVKAQRSELDKSDVWCLDFRWKDPRLIKAYIPGRGTRICWYLWYQVVNYTGEPRTFIPEFQLVTTDQLDEVYKDEVLPSVQEAIKKLEDPTGYQNIQNSVTIASKPIPPSQPEDAFPRRVTGVAIWDGTSADPKDRPAGKRDLSDSNRYTIFVSGLSNGWVLAEPLGKGPDAVPRILRKTLQLKFKRLGDRYAMDSREITFEPPASWEYRDASLRIPTLKQGSNPAPGPGAFQLPSIRPNLTFNN